MFLNVNESNIEQLLLLLLLLFPGMGWGRKYQQANKTQILIRQSK